MATENNYISGDFTRQIMKIAHVTPGVWLRRGNVKRGTESLLRATQNNSVRTKYVNTHIDDTQVNSMKERERETDRQTDRQTDRDRDREKERERKKVRETGREKEKEREKERKKERKKERD